MKKTSGFTLAEVLITLGIIGVVAAMTIPTLMNQSSQAVFRTGLKKAVSVLNQAITMNVALNDTDFSALTSGTGSGSIYDMFNKRLQVQSTSVSQNINDVWGQAAYAVAANYSLYLRDGMSISFYPGAENCSTAGQSLCQLVVDVNGIKGPNSISTAKDTSGSLTDQFVLDFYNQKVAPHDNAAKYALYGMTSSSGGQTCPDGLTLLDGKCVK